MNKITWGMIGCGDVTEEKNGPGLYLNANSELRAITNRTYEKALDWSKRHHSCVVYKSVDELVADPQIDIVYIATTPDCHLKYAIQCANAGKHVYIEKPIALSYEEAIAIEDCCKRNNVKAFVAHYRRGLPQFIKAKELLETGAIGTPLSVQITSLFQAESLEGWRSQANTSGGGHFFEADIHGMDIIDYLLGAYREVFLAANPFPEKAEIERSVSAVFRWDNGMIGSGTWCFDAEKDEDCVKIYGTKGSLAFSVFDLSEPLMLSQGGKTTPLSFEIPAYVGMPHEKLIADTLLGVCERSDICTLENAMRTLKITDAMRTAKSSGKTVRIENEN